MEIVIISVAAFFTAILTFFSGFGLGTILMPVFALFFPVDIAIALTGVVHFANNIFKMGLVGKMASKPVLIRFGVPAILASFAGAWVLLLITGWPSIYEYQLWGNTFEITPVKLIIAVLLLFFSLLEVLPVLQKIEFGGNRLILGGILSGFFGGLAGIQGAFRSAFLIKADSRKRHLSLPALSLPRWLTSRGFRFMPRGSVPLACRRTWFCLYPQLWLPLRALLQVRSCSKK